MLGGGGGGGLGGGADGFVQQPHVPLQLLAMRNDVPASHVHELPVLVTASQLISPVSPHAPGLGGGGLGGGSAWKKPGTLQHPHETGQ